MAVASARRVRVRRSKVVLAKATVTAAEASVEPETATGRLPPVRSSVAVAVWPEVSRATTTNEFVPSEIVTRAK